MLSWRAVLPVESSKSAVKWSSIWAMPRRTREDWGEESGADWGLCWGVGLAVWPPREKALRDWKRANSGGRSESALGAVVGAEVGSMAEARVWSVIAAKNAVSNVRTMRGEFVARAARPWVGCMGEDMGGPPMPQKPRVDEFNLAPLPRSGWRRRLGRAPGMRRGRGWRDSDSTAGRRCRRALG